MAARDRLRRARTLLPTGDTLARASWGSRHLWICRLLWAHLLIVPIYGVSQGKALSHALLEAGVLVGPAVAASLTRLDDTTRSLAATLGLVVASATLVHFSGGLIEMHFHFFVVVVVVSLYQSWRPFLVALVVVVLHHGVAGTLDPTSVYNHPSALARPWLWGLVHAGFILAESVACLVAWRLNEDALARERDALADLGAAQRLAALGSWELDLQTGDLTWSDELHRILGVASPTTPSTELFFGLVHVDDRAQLVTLLDQAKDTNGELDHQCRVVTPDGQTRFIHALGRVVACEQKRKMIGTCQDVTERHVLEEEITYRAFYDSLTGLANRALFMERLEHAVTVGARAERVTVVLYVDLDGFKEINDRLGHRAGDQVLVEVASRLQGATRDTDTVARLAGDEFAVLLDNADPAQGERTAHRILASLARPVVTDQQEVLVVASVGLADTRHGSTADELLHFADQAMYAAKRTSAGTCVAYDPRMSITSARRSTLRSQLPEAIRQHQFVLHYQPIVDLRSGQLEAVEALVRWAHPQFGMQSPAEFIELAEQSGQITALGDWVTREATRAAVSLGDELGFPVRVSVNLAVPQLDGDLVGSVESALDQSGLSPDRLTLELTETCLMGPDPRGIAKLEALRRLGVKIAIDDFGTGYSSLAYLQRLPIDILKIDKTFIGAVTDGPAEAGLVDTIVKLAGILGMYTVAEGIETPAQANLLRELGVGYGQGYLYSRPAPPAALIANPTWRDPALIAATGY